MDNMDTHIRPATSSDFPAILNLIKELALFVHHPDKVSVTVEQMQREAVFFNALVAETQNSQIVGMAVYTFTYFTWVGKSLYLDDLYVKEAWRRRGIGTSFIQQIFRIAERESCHRVRWQVLDWNTPALNLYKQLGSEIDEDTRNCNFDEAAIHNIASQSHRL